MIPIHYCLARRVACSELDKLTVEERSRRQLSLIFQFPISAGLPSHDFLESREHMLPCHTSPSNSYLAPPQHIDIFPKNVLLLLPGNNLMEPISPSGLPRKTGERENHEGDSQLPSNDSAIYTLSPVTSSRTIIKPTIHSPLQQSPTFSLSIKISFSPFFSNSLPYIHQTSQTIAPSPQTQT